MRPAQLLAAVVALSSVSAASSNVLDNSNVLGEIRNILYPRQDESSTARPASSARDDEPQSTAEPTVTEKPTATDKDDVKSTGKASGSQKPTTTGGHKSYGPEVGVGVISMVTPAPIAGNQYYKIGDWVTFAWNYSSLKVTPSFIDIMATCTENQATYTLAVNQSVKATGMVLWDTGAYQNDPNKAGPPLLTETYTLMIYDAESSVSAIPQPGYLSTFKNFQFGMYEPQDYVPLKDYKCANCQSAALSAFEQLTFKVLLVTFGTTVASFLYFTTSFGLW